MNLALLSRMTGAIALLFGGAMIFSLPWAIGGGPRARDGFLGLLGSMAVCFVTAAVLWYFGRGAKGQLHRKEAMAVVGLSWALATILGALPFLFSGTYREPGVRMTIADAMFESQSGFSTTGATVITNVQDPEMIPRSILFWRSSTHFLGGLGIIVLFVAILGQGSAGKALMRAEMPGPSQDSPQARMQHTAWVLFFIYTALNAVLTVILKLEGMSWFDAICHAFGTMATGGFSTYNASVGYFATQGDKYHYLAIEWTILVFMVIAGTNFMLLYYVMLRRPGPLLRDVEWRTYISVLALVTIVVAAVGMSFGDFLPRQLAEAVEEFVEEETGQIPHGEAVEQIDFWRHAAEAFRYSSFQVVSVMTTTGYGTHDFDAWNNFGRGILFLLMFVGGCAGSTGGGLKVIRHVLFHKILWLETERAYHPNVVRPLRLGGKALDDQSLRHSIVVYFGMILVIFVFSWILVVAFEPDSTWIDKGASGGSELIDSATGVAATLNNIGPGLGTVGATQNYAHFSWPTKLLFTWLMMLGRLELFVVLVLFLPGFWRNQ